MNVNLNSANEGKGMALGEFRGWRFCGPLLVFAVLAGGCNQEDAERMARVGRKLTNRAEALTGDQDGGLKKGWQAVRDGWQETTLAGRVAARLRWDKRLADAHIHASATGNAVQLKGSVRDLEQRRRALDLAESTTGVEKVTDGLEIAAP
jgi:osmotically-inducible protein OsmY